MRDLDISRRRMLAGLGATGAVSVVGLGLATEGAVAYTTESVDIYQGDGFTLTSDWRETYNDEVLEDTRSTEFTPEGAVISLGSVVPGDSGTVSFRLGVTPDDETDEISVEPRFSLDLTGTAENGINEPEREAGDSSPNQGELQDALDVKLWYDEGLGNYDVFGGDNATQDPGESLIADGAEGTLAEVAQDVNDVPLDANPSTDQFDCLTTEETITVSFGWEFDSGSGNITQTDSVTFDFTITADMCE